MGAEPTTATSVDDLPTETVLAIIGDVHNEQQNAILHRTMALRDDYPNPEVCWAWMESAQRTCGKPHDPATPHLCERHAKIARKRREREFLKDRAKRQRQVARDTAAAPARLEKLRAERDRNAREMARRDPRPPTDDLAAYGGVGCAATSRYQQRIMSDTNVQLMAFLTQRQPQIEQQIAYYERTLRLADRGGE